MMSDGLQNADLVRTLVMAGKGHAALAVGFSGGGDSLALLVMCAHFTKAQNIPLHALIVDHALRPGSANEAKRAAEQAEKLGAQAHILRSACPRAGHKHARAARYTLLAGACRAIGARGVLLGHTREDQAETFALRLARRSGARGLACMRESAPFPLWPQGRGLCVWRPLLGMRRTDLRDFIRYKGLSWIDDPSNQDQRYARVRVRTWLQTKAGAPFVDRFFHSAHRLARIERKQTKMIRCWADKNLSLDRFGFARLPWRLFAVEPDATALRVLGLALCIIAGRPHAPSLAALSSVIKNLRAGRGGVTLGGCYLVVKERKLSIFRDPGAVLGRRDVSPLDPVFLEKGETTVIDNRFVVHAPQSMHVSFLGNRAAQLPKNQHRELMMLPAPARPVLPVFSSPDGRLDAHILDDADAIRFLGVQMRDHLTG